MPSWLCAGFAMCRVVPQSPEEFPKDRTWENWTSNLQAGNKHQYRIIAQKNRLIKHSNN